MKHWTMGLVPLLAFAIVCCASDKENQKEEMDQHNSQTLAPPIADYVVEIFEDSSGNLWFGTVDKGVAKYDGDTLTYLTMEDGLPSDAVVDILEDEHGVLWMATQNGLVRYEDGQIKTFTEADGLPHFRLSGLMIDQTGILWIASWGGVGRYDGKNFEIFDLPKPDVDLQDYEQTADWVTEIIEDSQGKIWIARDGYGLFSFDGTNFQFLTKENGLPSNHVMDMDEDKQGQLWISCRVAEGDHPDPVKRNGLGGVVYYDGTAIINQSIVLGFERADSYLSYCDKSGDMWLAASGVGIQHFDGTMYTEYRKTNRMDLTRGMGVNAALKDHTGRMWFGFSGGLFRWMDGEIVHVSASGPWN